ncbi:MAG TPA: hydroxymethylglutaryl-CoA reductase [Pyrinomonadaceae bacterium]|nr:hydroxymethylglutaryl-CoA reductase [Pyrinomonadaceae bacterium]
MAFFPIPSMLLRQLYTFNSLKNTENGVQFAIKNRLTDVEFSELKSVAINGVEIPKDKVTFDLGDGNIISADSISESNPIPFPLRKVVLVNVANGNLPTGKHKIEIAVKAKGYGSLKFDVEDAIAEIETLEVRIPRDNDDDYSESAIKTRQEFVHDFTGATFEHLKHYSFDPHILAGNIEHFTGVAQIPIGFAGPLKVNGEFATGDFMIPMATTEGTLVASYNRGIKVLNLSGGVKTTVVADAMQRAPVFVFEDAREGRKFVSWVLDNFAKIKEEAEATSSIAKLKDIDHYTANKFVYLRFNYTTGDAAGQNMVGRATFAACSWIIDVYEKEKIKHFYLESNFATDKKASQVNIMRTRGKRVTAECTVPRNVLIEHMRVEPESLTYHSGVANVGSFLSGANNNGAHSANGITAMFIATGQDVANVSESSAGIIYSELTPEKDLYISITIPSLIVATYGGGTGLATQKECLEILGCYGRGGVNKLAEIIAGVVLAGEISLASAISSSDWVSSHEKYGRNR